MWNKERMWSLINVFSKFVSVEKSLIDHCRTVDYLLGNFNHQNLSYFSEYLRLFVLCEEIHCWVVVGAIYWWTDRDAFYICGIRKRSSYLEKWHLPCLERQVCNWFQQWIFSTSCFLWTKSAMTLTWGKSFTPLSYFIRSYCVFFFCMYSNRKQNFVTHAGQRQTSPLGSMDLDCF